MLYTYNRPLEYQEQWFENVYINSHALMRNTEALERESRNYNKAKRIDTLLFIIRSIDLTTLAGDDTYVNIQRLCERGFRPLSEPLAQKLVRDGRCKEPPTVASVCVYPSRIRDCFDAFGLIEPGGAQLKVAAVAAGFPSGLYGLETRIGEIEFVEACSAAEVDIVIDRSLALNGDWREVYEEIRLMRVKAPTMRLKAILEVGELGDLVTIYKACFAAMLAGVDFIKTSTGKATINATLPVGLVMTRAIADFYDAYGVRVGLKPAGGLKTEEDCYAWYRLVESELGTAWLNPNLFRIGASSLLNAVEKGLFKLVFHRNPQAWEISV